MSSQDYSPEAWMAKGARVDYASVIGEPPTLHGCVVTEDPWQIPGPFGRAGAWVTMIDRMRGWVACEALTQAKEKP